MAYQTSNGQVTGGHLQTKESFTFGRFQTSMRPGFGSGVISSFFLFSDVAGFQNNWNELDFEWLGRNTNAMTTNIIKTVNGVTDKNINVRHHVVNKRSSDLFWLLTLDWLPDKIVWRINNVVIREKYIVINAPMKLMVNIWQTSAGWSGDFNAGLLPQQSQYDYISYSKYVNGAFVPTWTEDFASLNLTKWYIPEFLLGNTMLSKANVSVSNSKLLLALR